jgi:hypothetical protein
VEYYYCTHPLLVCTNIKLPQYSIRVNHHLPTFPKTNTLTDKHTKLLILQRAHPTSPERLVPVLKLCPVIVLLAVFLRHRRRSRTCPLALEPTHEKVRGDDAVARDAWCERVVAQRATHGARRALAKGRANVFVRRYPSRWDRSDQVVHGPMMRRDPFSRLGTECLTLGAGQGVVDVTLSR